ncbi:MAG: hypothetical protein PHQ43_15005 [Dehalococcoidales bacterium]|nr:hypothetical protein [Dehalococcoidales bacterium]
MPMAIGAPVARVSTLIVDADLDMGPYALKTDSIDESSLDNGVVIDGATAKDGTCQSKESTHNYDVSPLFSIVASDNVLSSNPTEIWTYAGILRKIYFPFPRVIRGSTATISFEYRTDSSISDHAHNFYLKTDRGTILWSAVNSKVDTYTPVTVSDVSLTDVSYLYLETTRVSTQGRGYVRNVSVKADATIVQGQMPTSGCEIV